MKSIIYTYLKIKLKILLATFHDLVFYFIPVFPTPAVVTPEGSIFFAAEDEGKTEEPTERRKQKEREKGRVPKSPEIASSLVTLGVLLTLFILSGWLLERIFHIFTFFLGNLNQLPEVTAGTLKPLLLRVVREMAYLLAPAFLIAFIMAVAGNIVQVGFLFTLKPLQLDFSRIKLTPLAITRKIFFSKQVGFNLVKTIAKVLFLVLVSYFLVYSDFLLVLKTSSLNVGDSLKTLGFIGFKIALVLTAILLAISIPDYFYQRHEFMENIKMSKQEIKEELKETEGDPLVKQRQRKRSMEMLRRGMLTQVKKADVVITNPIHFAVALRYDPEQETAPRVLAKGEDHLALVIKNLAKKDNVPLIENKPLARELYYHVNENEVVPEHFYRILIDIFLSIEGIRERLQGRAS